MIRCRELWTELGYLDLSPAFATHYPWDSPVKKTRVGCHFLSLGNLPHPGIKPVSPALQADSLSSEPPGKPQVLAGEADGFLF